MRRLTSVLLTALVLVNLFGFYGIFILKQADIKADMAEKISHPVSTEHCETLSFDKAVFAKLLFNDNGKEFRYNGRLYDVVNIKSSGNLVKVMVEYDASETALVETFGSLFGQQQDKDQSSSPVKIIISHFQQDYIICYFSLSSLNNSSITGYCRVNRSYPVSCFVADALAPPPKFFLV
jgi:hypothetical protein